MRQSYINRIVRIIKSFKTNELVTDIVIGKVTYNSIEIVEKTFVLNIFYKDHYELCDSESSLTMGNLKEIVKQLEYLY